jgi:hypothetical protein
MGACNCKEEEREYGNLYTSENTTSKYDRKNTSKYVSKGTFIAVKETPNPNQVQENIPFSEQNQIPHTNNQSEEIKSIKMIEYQTKGEELPFSIYASVERDDSIKIEDLESVKVAELKNSSIRQESFISNLEDSIRKDNQIVLTFDQEYEYDEFSNNVFNMLNSLRTTPEKFVNSYDHSNY